ncbi:DNA polymerase family B [Tetraselmis virus 1]|uniref:DNA polymerase n=1 Tax=Tetraselmis virus 1 TaxID=2060617 RepID=A0A2P0VPD0_9VIRU|nr:DNA polymerase family B [Tetraselmis virus 1]AUF82649.1 DNA polymerase family B [Tetraselmis virus 1]
MKFQIVDWEVSDVPETEIPECFVTDTHSRFQDDEDDAPRYLYTVIVYGRTKEGKSVCLKLTQFQPYFYLKVDGIKDYTPHLSNISRHIISNCFHLKREIQHIVIGKKCDFYGFSANEKKECVIVTFDSWRAMRSVASKLRSSAFKYQNKLITLYETRVEPLMRLLHSREIKSTGWVEIEDSKIEFENWGATDICGTTSYKNVDPLEVDDIAPMLMASFDIECTVESDIFGDFPVAIKSYRRIANNIKDTLEIAMKYDLDPYKAKELIQIVIFYTLGMKDVEGRFADTVNWMNRNNASCLTQRVLGSVRTKETLSTTALYNYLYIIVDDLFSYATGDIKYEDKSQPSGPVEQIDSLLSKTLPPLKGDPVIQIGVTCNTIGNTECSSKWISVLNSCDHIPGVEVESYETEEEVIMAFARYIRKSSPDLITGYNIFGFDMKYLHERTLELGISDKFLRTISRLNTHPAKFVEKRLSSSALGDNVFWMLDIPGIVSLDLMKVVMRDHKLESYKLDNVAQHFTGEKKRDVPPKDIFRLQNGTSKDRSVVADYCVQDCALCNVLLEKLKVVVNAIAMASMSHVPISYIFLRGQGVKILSLVSYYCRKRDMIIKDLPKKLEEPDEDAPLWKRNRYRQEAEAQEFMEKPDDIEVQGAIVLEPDVGFYVDDPVAVCDYASLYPSSILSHGISPDAWVKDDSMRKHPDYTYKDVSYEIYEGKGDDKKVVGMETLTFAIKKNVDVYDPNTLSIIPAIERILLMGRKSIRKKAKHKKVVTKDGTEYVGDYSELDGDRIKINGVVLKNDDVVSVNNFYNQFMQDVLDGQQLSYKLLANSVYGQLGARTSDIRDMKLAACVTSVGRSLIISAKDFIHKNGGTVVYGDTDSVFCTFPVYDPVTGERLKGKDALPYVIEKTQYIGKEFTKTILPPPHDLEYEKTFWPLLLLAKKKYVGNMYEEDPEKFKLKYMGVVLKRRDNAPIVRRVISTLLDVLLNEIDVTKALDNMLKVIDDVVNANVPIEELVITKTLRAEYKDRSRIAHAVLAQRIGERDPGNAPQINDRIPMVHIRVPAKKGEKILQGDKVEDPEYVQSAGLEPDMEYYLENQIMNPTIQMLAALLEKIPGYNKPIGYYERKTDEYTLQYKNDTSRNLTEETIRKKVREAIDKIRQEEVRKLVFEPKLAKIRNKYKGQLDLTTMGFFFKM